MSVNYMLEIIGLDDWELTHHLTPTAYKLMRKLQYLANKERFPERMNVSNGLLMSMIGCSEDSLIKARNQLMQAGLIQYKGQKKMTPLYRIQYFSHKPEYNPKKQSYMPGIKQGYTSGNVPGKEQGTYINNTSYTSQYAVDAAEADEGINNNCYAHARELIEASFQRNFGRSATPAEAHSMATAVNLNGSAPLFLIDRAINTAACRGAVNPVAYTLTLFSDWVNEHFETPMELDEYLYLQNCAAGRISSGAMDGDEAQRLLTEQRQYRQNRYDARRTVANAP